MSSDSLPPISKEQYEIVQYLQRNNVHVQAVAGCGKTTTNLFIANHNRNDKILLLTYNSSLRIDTKKKIKKYNVSNMEVHTYHSFGYTYYKNCINDIALYEIIDSDLIPKKKFNYSIIIFDEMQDITVLYLQFAQKLLKDNNCKTPRLCLLGDMYQTIYQYNGSDERFFKFFPTVFSHMYPWKHCLLNKTFRCTDQIANFLNEIMLNNEKRILTSKKGEKIRYIQCEIYSSRVFEEINYYLDLGYKYEDIFILAPSVKSKSSPVIKLANLCAENDIPIYVSSSDDDKPNEKVLSNKITFLTFHQSKGLERKVCIIMGFDMSYFLFFKKENNQNVCPNELYVAVTRVLERLSCIHDVHFDYLPFLDVGKIHRSEIVHFECMELSIRKNENYEKYDEMKKSVSVSRALKHISFHKVIGAYKKCKVLEVIPIHYENIIDIPATCIQKNHYYENVSDITSLAIISFFQFRKTGKILIRPSCNNLSDISIQLMCRICTEVITTNTKFLYKIYQIENYDWITPEQLELCMQRLNSLDISQNAVFEKEIQSKCNRIHGRVDCWDTKYDVLNNKIVHRIYEFKCISTLDFLHILQLALYAYIIHSNVDVNENEKYEFYLFNVFDGNLLVLQNNLHELIEIVEILLKDRNNFINHHISFTDTCILNILKRTFS